MEHERQSDKEIAKLREEFNDFKCKIEPVIEVWAALTGLVTVLRWIGMAAKWFAGIGAAIAAVWAIGTHWK